MIIAGCVINIITGLIALGLVKLGLHYYPLFLFGFLSLWLGITNLIPFPALDGSYPILVWLEKFMGKEKGYELMGKIVGVGFVILMILNIVSLGILAWWFRLYILNYFIGVICFILNLITQLIALIAISGLK
jgi:membrane-associated protease RseP (regulator of RpoE activity)